MKIFDIPEPDLEFGAGRHIDIRFGIANYAPLDFDSPLAPKDLTLGIVGSEETIEGVSEWLQRVRDGVPAKESNQPNLFTNFPGCTPDLGFRTRVTIDNRLSCSIPTSELKDLSKVQSRDERISQTVNLFIDGVRYLKENTSAKVVICALPLSLLKLVGPRQRSADGEDSVNSVSRTDFHDLLKARAMALGRPIQLVLPATYDPDKQRSQSRAGVQRTLQDEATRAWNIYSALYYKGGGIPWRLPRDTSAYTTCYVGISFYNSLDRQRLLTSVAQVFDQRGEGVVVRGGPAKLSKDDRQPHLNETDAHQLLVDALARYRDVHRTQPARVVIHKSSRFDNPELQGFQSSLSHEKIELYDLLALRNSPTRLFRAGQYPPLRGTVLILDDDYMVVYTRGGVPFFETYPGKYVPIPLLIEKVEADQTQKTLATEILALSKMNWNDTQFDGAEPITLDASRRVSNVLRFCEQLPEIEPRYSFYM